MADDRRARRARGRAGAGLALVAAVLAPVLLAGCGEAPGDRAGAPAEIRRVLDARAAAVLARDEPGYLAALDPAADRLRAEELRHFRNLTEVPLASWEYRLGEVRRRGDRATAEAELRYRISGYDSGPVTAARTLELARRDGRWHLTADRAAEGGAQQLWHQGPVRAVRGERSLILGVGHDEARLTALARTADRSVPAVSDAWPTRWAGRVVVLAPRSLEAMGALLGAPAAGYRGIAAVTTGETGTTGEAPADRVIVNPAAYDALGDFGKRVVITHETTHVATRAHTSPATPMWLSEGFADWVAYRDTGRTAAQTAPELHRAVRRGDLPPTLPANDDFAFGGSPQTLARAYESGWLACELIADHWSETHLTDFYRALTQAPDPTTALPSALTTILSTTPEAFTALWHDYLRQRLTDK
ncbi:hypothetical protein GCM10010387_11530 [Streptomyces inusitatus]|uniref:Lipoprotein n=1 Tax=Streptomyces inusitatus TaxID=68221 RepID=A0A918PRG1_9ACTN|nr:hypothetical protein [Streptomyces inusitatus]GGZ20272.1 hypothetical protein GCM10010387_11530 [Streptomyces inusitatus]